MTTEDQDPAGKKNEAERKRRIQALEMQRERVLSERTSSPHRRSALEMALASIEYELEQLPILDAGDAGAFRGFGAVCHSPLRKAAGTTL